MRYGYAGDADRACGVYLQLDRLAGCVEYIPPFKTCLVRDHLRAGRRRAPDGYGPLSEDVWAGSSVDSVGRRISESPIGRTDIAASDDCPPHPFMDALAQADLNRCGN